MFLKAHNKLGLGLSLRLSLWYGIFIALVLVAASTATYLVMAKFIREREISYLDSRLSEYQNWLIQGGLPALQARFNDLQSKEKEGFFLRVIDPKNQITFYSVPRGLTMLSQEQINKIPTTYDLTFFTIPHDPTHSQWTVLTRKLSSNNITLQAGKNSTESAQVLQKLKSVFLMIILPLMTVALIIGAFITYRTTRPLRDLNATMQKLLQEGNLNARVPLRSSDPELGALSAQFNRLLGRNERLMQLMRESIDNAAHDLRTPLTRLRNAAESALSGSKSEAELREGLADCLEESEYVLQMLEVTMDVAEAKTGSLKLTIGSVNLNEICQRVMEVYELVAEEKEIHLQLEAPHAVNVLADPVRIQQVIGNLLDNAIKYSGANTTVTLHIGQDATHGILAIHDQGQGISEQDLPRIWDRMFRADHSRSQRGLGLGLSLVQAIVQAHNGSISVVSKLHQGSTFTLQLPLVK